MGILLAFMFIWNMIGAVVLIPALSHFLLPSGSRVTQRVTKRAQLQQRIDNDDHAAPAEYRHAV